MFKPVKAMGYIIKLNIEFSMLGFPETPISYTRVINTEKNKMTLSLDAAWRKW